MMNPQFPGQYGQGPPPNYGNQPNMGPPGPQGGPAPGQMGGPPPGQMGGPAPGQMGGARPPMLNGQPMTGKLHTLNHCYLRKAYPREVAQWLGGRVLDLKSRGYGFESHQCHCVVTFCKPH